jgi:hypothetical protein
MKSIIICLFTCMASFSYAADLFVQEFGGGGTFSTISDAITASSNGDRILVQPKAGNASFIESLTVNKAIQILTASNGNRFFLQGNITIATTLAAGSTVVIDGVNITIGGISQTTNSTNAVNVYIVNSVLQSGFIRFAQRFNVTVANNTVTGTTNTSACIVDICRGHILGNTVNAVEGGIRVQSDAINNTDTTYIVGNRVNLSTNFSNTFFQGINWGSSTSFCFIANNFVQQTNNNSIVLGTSSFPLINIGGIKPGTNSNERNNILNNTIVFNNTANNLNYTYIGITSGNDPSILILSNLIHFVSTLPLNRAAFQIGNQTPFSYNNASNTSTLNISVGTDPTNTTTAVTINTTTGCLTNNPDLGHPNAIFTDLDLTRNDWGACGGSFNATQNYFNTSTPGTAKVHLLLAPRRVLQGGTISIEAEGHDR